MENAAENEMYSYMSAYINYLPHSQEMGQVDPGLLDEQVLEDNDGNKMLSDSVCT